MSGWRSYLSGGRYSPFTSGPQRPTVTEDDYHYLGPEDIVDPPRHDSYQSNNYPRHGSRADAEDPRAPDILILKHRGTTYPLHFPAFTIGEGLLRVGELRKFAAQQTSAGNPARVKLLYKGKVLKDDAVACREEGLKQNSELMCVISDAPSGGKSDDESSDDSASEDEMAYEERVRGGDGPRVDVDGSLIGSPRRRKHRGKKSRRYEDEAASSYPSQSAGNSSSTAPPPPQPRPTSAAPPPRTSSTPQPPRPATTAPAQPPPPPSNGPKTPNQKLDEVMHIFHDKFEPMAEHFLANVPQEHKAMKQEYMKLSESILSQVIFKLDGVETEGDPDARAKRKALVQETQTMLNRLDAVGKDPEEQPASKGKKGRRNR